MYKAVSVIFSNKVFTVMLGGCSSDIPSSYLFRLSKVSSMLHHVSVGRVQNKIKNALIYCQVLFGAGFVVFHNKVCVFIMMYALNTAYFYEGEMSVGLYAGHVTVNTFYQ